MTSPLIPITIPSIYKDKAGNNIPLPAHMAKCTPDAHAAIISLSKSLEAKGGNLMLSDMFRNDEMQHKAYDDYISGHKKAFSPRPGGSFHEAGRAFDIDLSAIKIPLSEFWRMVADVGVCPIIKQPDPTLLEAWHFECRGSHQLVYDYYVTLGSKRNLSPYTAAAASAILSIGVVVDVFGDRQVEAAIQSCLIRLGKDIGNMDGVLGVQTKGALEEMGLKFSLRSKLDMLYKLEGMIKLKLPGEC